MTDFNSSLIREKFVIRDHVVDQEGQDSIIALSNRFAVPLINPGGKIVETFIVRGQNMHITVRFAAKLDQQFKSHGKIMAEPDFDWKGIWTDIIDGFEKKFNPHVWIAVYFEGKCVFESGTRHPFLDIIEKFDHMKRDDYEQAVIKAEKAFQEARKTVKIEHDTNIALVSSINPKQAKCGVILRSAGNTTTFNFTAKENRGNAIKTSQCLSVAAAYLEGIQLAFAVGMGKKKIFLEIIENELERQRTYEGEARLGRLNHAISQFDVIHDVNYRPERPDLFRHMAMAEKFADKILRPQIEAKIAAGEIEGEGWIT